MIFICLESNDYCFVWAEGQLLKGFKRNTVSTLRILAKSHEGLKGTGLFDRRCSKESVMKFFYGKVEACCRKRFLSQIISYDFCLIIQNSYFVEQLWTASSKRVAYKSKPENKR